jgi:uncharacterized protein YlbG (UPF0298 family)
MAFSTITRMGERFGNVMQVTKRERYKSLFCRKLKKAAV